MAFALGSKPYLGLGEPVQPKEPLVFLSSHLGIVCKIAAVLSAFP